MIVKILIYLLGILSLIYFGGYAGMIGLTNKFTYFWLLLGICCIVIAIFWKKLYHCLHSMHLGIKIAVSVAACIGIITFVIVEGMLISYGNAVPQPGADYVIVLGTQVRGTKPSYNLARRLDAAYDYLIENPDTQAILSGGQGESEYITEAQAMAEYLEEKGIAASRLILEDQSKNTDENLRYSRERLSSPDASVVLVTNGFHVFRSVKIAEKQGLQQVQSIGAPIMWYTIPNLYVREAFAIIKYALSGQI